MLKAINLTKTVDVGVATDPAFGTSDQTTFTIGAIDGRVMAVIADSGMSLPADVVLRGGETQGEVHMNVNVSNFTVVQFGLKGITNYDIPYSTEKKNLGGKTYLVASESLVSSFDLETLSELSNLIMNFNTMSETDRKNSEES